MLTMSRWKLVADRPVLHGDRGPVVDGGELAGIEDEPGAGGDIGERWMAAPMRVGCPPASR
jgi:hypothetical protein